MEVLLIFALLYAGGQQAWKRTNPGGTYSATSAATRSGVRTGARSARETWDRRRPDRAAQRKRRRERWARSGIFGWLLVQAERGTVGAGRLVADGTACAYRGVRDGGREARGAWQATWRDHHPEPAETGPDQAVPVPVETDQDSPQDSGTAGEDSPAVLPPVTTIPGNRRYEPDPYKTVLTRQPDGNVQAEVFYTGAPEVGEQSIWDDEFLSPEAAQRGAEDLIQEVQGRHGRRVPATVSWVDRTVTAVPPGSLYGTPTEPPAGTPFFPDAPDGPALDSEADIRARNPELARVSPDPLTEGQRRFWHLRDRGYPGALDQDGWPAPDFPTGAIVNPMPYLNSPTGASPDGAITPTPITTGGTPMGLRDAITGSANREPARGTATATLTRPAGGGGEVDDLATLQRIAAQVVQQHEESEFMKLIRLCQTLPESADFGDRVGKVLAEFGELCVALGKVGIEVAEMAPGVTQVAGHVRGES